jgi:hypothetical protein
MRSESALEKEQDFVPDTAPVVAAKEEEADTDLDSGEIRERLLDIRNSMDKENTEMCKLLWTVKKKSLHESWNFQSFGDYVGKELQVKITKAKYMVQIWEHLWVRQDDKTVFEKVMTVGWTKAKELIHVVTKENVDFWVEKARNFNVEGLIKEVKAHLKSLIPDDPNEALSKSGQVEGTPAEDAMKSITFQFSYDDYLAVSQAIDKIKSSEVGISNSQAVALACKEFLGSNPQEGERADFVLPIMRNYERLYPLNIVVIDKEAEEIIYGFEYLKDLVKGENGKPKSRKSKD